MSKLNILIIGASGGIGKHLSTGLADSGNNLALHFHSGSEDFDHSVKELSHGENIVKKYAADITDETEVKDMVSKINADFGSIDVLINNAGLSLNGVSWKLSLDDWNKVIAVNLTGPFLCTKHVLPFMKEKKFGRIIYISSVVPQIGVPGTAAYSASKAGLYGLCKTIQKEVIKSNITANIISLGYFDAGLLYQIPEDIRGQIKESIPMKEFGDPAELVECIRFISSNKSSYLTGQCINLNGGLF